MNRTKEKGQNSLSNQPKSSLSILSLIARTLVGGIVIGGVIAVAGQIIYLIIVFPLIMGVSGGVVAAVNVSRLGIRRRGVAALVGIMLGLLIYGSYRYIDYLLFIRHLTDTTSISFADYLHLVAGFGLTIGTSSLSMPLGENLTWVYWIFEIILVIGIASYLSLLSIRREGMGEIQKG